MYFINCFHELLLGKTILSRFASKMQKEILIFFSSTVSSGIPKEYWILDVLLEESYLLIPRE